MLLKLTQSTVIHAHVQQSITGKKIAESANYKTLKENKHEEFSESPGKSFNFIAHLRLSAMA